MRSDISSGSHSDEARQQGPLHIKRSYVGTIRWTYCWSGDVKVPLVVTFLNKPTGHHEMYCFIEFQNRIFASKGTNSMFTIRQATQHQPSPESPGSLRYLSPTYLFICVFIETFSFILNTAGFHFYDISW